MSEAVLFYSTFCKNCDLFREKLNSAPKILATFDLICIDTVNNKRPDVFYQVQKELGITRVPCVILPMEDIVLEGVDAFVWLESLEQPKQPKQENKKPPALMGPGGPSQISKSDTPGTTSDLLPGSGGHALGAVYNGEDVQLSGLSTGYNDKEDEISIDDKLKALQAQRDQLDEESSTRQ